MIYLVKHKNIPASPIFGNAQRVRCEVSFIPIMFQCKAYFFSCFPPPPFWFFTIFRREWLVWGGNNIYSNFLDWKFGKLYFGRQEGWMGRCKIYWYFNGLHFHVVLTFNTLKAQPLNLSLLRTELNFHSRLINSYNSTWIDELVKTKIQ